MQQMVVYVGGIGALGTPQSRFEEAVTGNTMDYKIRYVYRFIVDNYVDGDEIFLFGYSRGAFTARAVVGLIKWAGILRKSNVDCFDAVWHSYKNRSENSGENTGSQSKREIKAGWSNADEERMHLNPRICCVGVFDTVASLKAPPLWLNTTDDIQIARTARRRYDNLDVDLGEVENVLQALALDERRFDFYPAVLAGTSSKDQNFKQTWFPGVHADMGGRNMTPLGLFPLIWMISKLQEVKLLEFDDEYLRRNILHPLVNADSEPLSQPVIPSHFIDRHPTLRRLLPHMFLPWLRYVHRNPNMPARIAASHPDPQPSDPNSEIQPIERTAAYEQMFHWTVIDRLVSGTGDYWEASAESRPNFGWKHRLFGFLDFHTYSPQICVALRRPNPLYPKVEVSIVDIEARVDRPTGIDKEMYTQFHESGRK